MLTQLFDPHDKRRESAFLLNYSGMNLGFFIGFTMSGIFQLHHNFHLLFLFSSFGSLISFVVALLNWKHLKDKGTIYIQSKFRFRRVALAGLIILGVIWFLRWFLSDPNVINGLIFSLGIFVALLFAYFAWAESKEDRSKKIWAFIILSMSSLIFWTLYQMAPMGLTLFYVHNVHHQFLGFMIPPQWLQNINTVVIVLGGPLMALLNRHFRKKGHKISIPFQFTTALFLISIGLFFPVLGIHFADSNGISSMGWLIGFYLCQSIGELFISPIGYAMIGQLIPSKIQSLAMGAWLMVTGVAATLSNYFSQSALGSIQSESPLLTNPNYLSAFMKLAILALLGSVILFFLRSFLHRLIQEKPLSHNYQDIPKT